MIKCVTFDFGNTLAESINKKEEFYKEYEKFLKKQKLTHSFAEVKQAHEFAEKQYKSLDNTHKVPIGLFFEKQFFIGLGITKNKRLSKLLHKQYTDFRMRRTKLMPNAKSALKKLKKMKLSLSVITNTNDDINKKLAKKLNIYPYFDHFLMSHEEGSIKSELKLFNLLLKKINKNRKNKIQPNECLMVGNSLNEDTAAKQIGMKTIILTTRIETNNNKPSFEPDYYIKDLSELPNIIKHFELVN